MPEGHTIHRYARSHAEALGGRRLAVTSPQGRFAAGAARLDGRKLADVAAAGKHLFYRWSGGETLHVHLGLYGKFRLHRGNPPPPSEATRIAMADGDVTLYLSGPTICELIDPTEEEGIRARLGPDPLADAAAGGEFATNLSRRRIPIASALLDQKVVAGVGNVYRSELLFRQGIDPRRPANRLGETEVADLWADIVAQLRLGLRSGRIVTVELADIGARRRSELPRDSRYYVYNRTGEPCRRCGARIRTTELAARAAFWCPSCQSS